MTNTAKLLEERTRLMVRVQDINAALEALGYRAQPYRIRTLKNLRNTDLRLDTEVVVYRDAAMTSVASPAAHKGYIPGQVAADLLAVWGKEELDNWGVELEEVEK